MQKVALEGPGGRVEEEEEEERRVLIGGYPRDAMEMK